MKLVKRTTAIRCLSALFAFAALQGQAAGEKGNKVWTDPDVARREDPDESRLKRPASPRAPGSPAASQSSHLSPPVLPTAMRKLNSSSDSTSSCLASM